MFWLLSFYNRKNAQGGDVVLCAFIVVILIVMAAFTVDVAYMQMVRTELRASTDAAARAGAEALARTQSKDAAIQAAITTASANQVGGRGHKLADTDIILGSVKRNSSGGFVFAEGGKRLNAVRVNSELSKGSAHGPVGLFFGGRSEIRFLLPLSPQPPLNRRRISVSLLIGPIRCASI